MTPSGISAISTVANQSVTCLQLAGAYLLVERGYWLVIQFYLYEMKSSSFCWASDGLTGNLPIYHHQCCQVIACILES
uniref:Auxin response factor 19-like n=1 Tax=Rhizophora mucronata TaxID=61149 RepID=A0A2P2M9T2_RHIMU